MSRSSDDLRHQMKYLAEAIVINDKKFTTAHGAIVDTQHDVLDKLARVGESLERVLNDMKTVGEIVTTADGRLDERITALEKTVLRQRRPPPPIKTEMSTQTDISVTKTVETQASTVVETNTVGTQSEEVKVIPEPSPVVQMSQDDLVGLSKSCSECQDLAEDKLPEKPQPPQPPRQQQVIYPEELQENPQMQELQQQTNQKLAQPNAVMLHEYPSQENHQNQQQSATQFSTITPASASPQLPPHLNPLLMDVLPLGAQRPLTGLPTVPIVQQTVYYTPPSDGRCAVCLRHHPNVKLQYCRYLQSGNALMMQTFNLERVRGRAGGQRCITCSGGHFVENCGAFAMLCEFARLTMKRKVEEGPRMRPLLATPNVGGGGKRPSGLFDEQLGARPESKRFHEGR